MAGEDVRSARSVYGVPVHIDADEIEGSLQAEGAVRGYGTQSIKVFVDTGMRTALTYDATQTDPMFRPCI